MVVGKLDSNMEKNKIKSFFNAIQKISSKWIKDLEVRLSTIKLLEENVGRALLT